MEQDGYFTDRHADIKMHLQFEKYGVQALMIFISLAMGAISDTTTVQIGRRYPAEQRWMSGIYGAHKMRLPAA